MRIALIAPPWIAVPPSLYGGVERVLDALARALKKVGHEVVLFTTGDSTCPVERRFLFPVAQEERIGQGLPELRHVLAAYDDAAVLDADVVHDHTLFGPVYAQRFSELKVATTNHNPFDTRSEVYARIVGQVPIVAVSHAQKAAAPDIPVARVIHHGLDLDDFAFGTGEGGYCLYLGRMAEFKGVHRAIVAARGAGMPIVLAGAPRGTSERIFFENTVKPLLSDDATYVGEVSHREKVPLLANAAALLFPICWNEPFGLVVIEALACGTPVLAFREGAVSELVENGRTGFLCRDEQQMSARLGEVESIDRVGCRRVAEERFSADRMAREHVELYELIASGDRLSRDVRWRDNTTVTPSGSPGAGEVGEPSPGHT